MEEDIIIVEQIRLGNINAYAKLMKKYSKSLYFYINKIVFDKNEIEDLVQDTFIKAYLNIEKFNKQNSFSTWLFFIGKNICIDFLRKKKMDLVYDYDFIKDTDNTTILDQVIKEENLIKLNNVIDKLKPKQKELIKLKYFEELSISDIALKLGITKESMRATTPRVVENLKKIYLNYGK